MINSNMKGYSAIILGTIIMALGLAVGYVAGGMQNSEPEVQVVQELGTHSGNAVEEERCSLVSVNRFSCGHVIERSEGISATEGEAKGLFGEGCRVEARGEQLAVHRDFAYCCPEHYYTAASAGALIVYQTDAATLEQRVVCTLDANAGSAAYDEISAGMTFDGLEQINLYLEGIDE